MVQTNFSDHCCIALFTKMVNANNVKLVASSGNGSGSELKDTGFDSGENKIFALRLQDGCSRKTSHKARSKNLLL